MPATGGSLPGMALTIAIIGIVIGVLNFFGSCCGIAGIAGFSAMANSSAVQDAMKDDPKAAAEFDKAKAQIQGNVVPIYIQLGLGLILGGMLLGGSIGTLMRKEWGRNLLVMACLAGIAITIISFVISIATGNFGGGDMANMPDEQKAIAMGAMVGGLVFTVAYLAYYIWGWRYMSADQRRSYFS